MSLAKLAAGVGNRCAPRLTLGIRRRPRALEIAVAGRPAAFVHPPPPPSRTDASSFVLERHTEATPVLTPEQAARIVLDIVSTSFNFFPAGNMRAYPLAESQRPFHRAAKVVLTAGDGLSEAERSWTG